MVTARYNEQNEFMDFSANISNMQYQQVVAEEKQDKIKEQKIEENQPKTAEEMMQEAFKENKQGLEHAQGLYNHYVKTRIEEGDEKYQPKDLAQKAIKEANEILKHEEKEFNKWMGNAPAVYFTKKEEYSKEQWLEEFRENKKSKPEQNYLISNSQDGETAQKAIEAYEITINALNRRYISPDNTEKHELSVELANKNTIEKIDKKTQEFLDKKFLDNSDIAISYDEAFYEATLSEVKSYKKILNNGLEKERQQDIKTANEEYQSIMKETNEEYKTYDFETWAKTSSAREFQELIDKDNNKNKQTLKEIYSDLNRQNPAQITFDIEFDNNKKDREKAEIIFQKETKGKSIGGIKEIKLANTISQNIKKEKDKEIELNTPKDINDLADETLNNINSNQNFKEFYKLQEELEKREKAQEELRKAQEEEKKKLFEEYGQGEYYKPNWTYYDPKQQEQEQKKEDKEQSQENDPLKEFNEKLKLLELKHQKEQEKLEEEKKSLEKQVNSTIENIIEAGDTKDLLSNLRNLDKLISSLRTNKKQQENAPEKNHLEKIDLANAELRNDPELKKEVIEKLKEQREKEKELKKEKKSFDLSQEKAKNLSKKVDDMQQTNNPNAKREFYQDIDKILKGIDEAKKQEKQGAKTPAEEENIKQAKMLEKHFDTTIQRAKKEMNKYEKEQTQQKEQKQEKNQNQNQGVTR